MKRLGCMLALVTITKMASANSDNRIGGIRIAMAAYFCGQQRWAGLPHIVPKPVTIGFLAVMGENRIRLLSKGNLLGGGPWRPAGGVSLFELVPAYGVWAVQSDEWYSDANNSVPRQRDEMAFKHAAPLTLNLTGLACNYSFPGTEIAKRELVQEIARQTVEEIRTSLARQPSVSRSPTSACWINMFTLMFL